jgi:hypothetical protein
VAASGSNGCEVRADLTFGLTPHRFNQLIGAAHRPSTGESSPPTDGPVPRQGQITVRIAASPTFYAHELPPRREGGRAAGYRVSDLNFTPIRSACRQTTMQCRMALSKSRSNFGGIAAALVSRIAAPVDDKFRMEQSITEAPLLKMIWPDLRTRCRGAFLRSPRSCDKMILSGQRGSGGPLCRTR